MEGTHKNLAAVEIKEGAQPPVEQPAEPVVPPTEEEKAGDLADAGLDGAKELLSFEARMASIAVVPNGSEGSDANFPRNLHNAAELFLKVGHITSAKRLHVTTTLLFNHFSAGPDGRTTLSMGRGCVCWACGHAGLPLNADKCDKVKTTPKPICGNCGSDAQTNFARPTKPGVTATSKPVEMPWMELKAKPIDGAPPPGAMAPAGSIPAAHAGRGGGGDQLKKIKIKPNAPCGCGSGKKAKKCCHTRGN